MDTGAELLRADLSALAQPLNESAGLLKKDAVKKERDILKNSFLETLSSALVVHT